MEQKTPKFEDAYSLMHFSIINKKDGFLKTALFKEKRKTELNLNNFLPKLEEIAKKHFDSLTKEQKRGTENEFTSDAIYDCKLPKTRAANLFDFGNVEYLLTTIVSICYAGPQYEAIKPFMSRAIDEREDLRIYTGKIEKIKEDFVNVYYLGLTDSIKLLSKKTDKEKTRLINQVTGMFKSGYYFRKMAAKEFGGEYSNYLNETKKFIEAIFEQDITQIEKSAKQEGLQPYEQKLHTAIIEVLQYQKKLINTLAAEFFSYLAQNHKESSKPKN